MRVPVFEVARPIDELDLIVNDVLILWETGLVHLRKTGGRTYRRVLDGNELPNPEEFLGSQADRLRFRGFIGAGEFARRTRPEPVSEPVRARDDGAALAELLRQVGGRMPEERDR